MSSSFFTETLRSTVAFLLGNKAPDAAAISHVKRPTKESMPEDETERLRALGRQAFQAAMAAVEHGGPWRVEARAPCGDVVESCQMPGHRYTVFRLTATLTGCATERVWTHLRHDVENKGWMLAEARTLQTLEEGASDVQLQRSSPRLSNLVAGREFVLVRRWNALPGGAFLMAVASTDHSAAPPPSATPRADCGPGGWLLEPAGGGVGGGGAPEGSTRVRWAVDCSLGGWLPARVVDAGRAKYMLEYMNHLRSRCRSSAE